MAIFDNDGTANREIGKLYDNDGLVNHQAGKVYDNNSTTHSLIYQDRLDIYKDGVLLIPGVWRGGYFRYDTYDKSSYGGVNVVGGSRINYYAGGGYHRDFPARAWAATTGMVDLTPYKTATFDILVGALSIPNGSVEACVYYGTDSTSSYGGIGNWLTPLASAGISVGGRHFVTVDISNVNSIAGFGIQAYFGQKPVSVSIDCYNIYLE